MSRKISLGIAISLIAIACAITCVITMTFSLNLYNDKIADVQQREEINTRMQEIESYIRSYSIYNINDTDVKTGVYSGYLDGIDDAYAKYYTANEYYNKSLLESGTMVGLGMVIEREVGGYVKVTSVYENSPADNAGIVAGDVISSVNNVSVLESGYTAAESQINYGEEGTKLRFMVRHDGQETEYNLTRSKFEINSVKATLLDNGILYVSFSAINTLTPAQLKEVLDTHAGDGISGYILDLRNCSSGLYTPVSEILNNFIADAHIASAVYKNNSTKTVVETTGEVFTNLPISIIINEKTGGSAELIAVSLRDFNSAKVVGATTMGYALLQETKTFSDGTAIEISVAKIKTANEASSYADTGIQPEFTVEYTGTPEADATKYDTTTDEQLKKAVEVIISATSQQTSE